VLVCSADPFCCDLQWEQTCAIRAHDLCSSVRSRLQQRQEPHGRRARREPVLQRGHLLPMSISRTAALEHRRFQDLERELLLVHAEGVRASTASRPARRCSVATSASWR
jgi:hypothetical protein